MLVSHLLYFSLTSILISAPPAADEQFEHLAAQFVDEFPALSPVSATTLGDHRFDDRLDNVTASARAAEVEFYRGKLKRLEKIDASKLSRANQVDHALLENHLRSQLWRIEELQEWAWNPTVYTELCGGAIYGLMAREFAPIDKRLVSATSRLEQFPSLFEQIRKTLQPGRVPRIHAETAVKQNRGVLSILDNMVHPQVARLPAAKRERLLMAMKRAKSAVDEHQNWLENELLPNAGGDFRVGRERYDRKLAFTLQTSLSRKQIRERAERELRRVRERMYKISQQVYQEQFPFTQFPETPSPAYRQAMIRAGLEMAYRETPQRGEIVEIAKRSLALTTEFVREKDLITIPKDPVEIIVMPEFQRGVSLAYCDSPGPLDVGQKTFYAVAPLPKSWSDKQVDSFLREYNVRSIHNLTVHEAMPGHFVQIAHANRYPGKLRAVLASGVFIEGWAVYTEQMMAAQGLLDDDPLMKLIALKWYLRGIANAILDQAIHTEGVSREQAMRLMMEDTFQEEREAAGKWVRAQLTSAQLSTYFVGYLEHNDLRRETEDAWGDLFNLKTYHDKVLSYGSPPVKYARALLLNKDVPQ
ncbi:MAG: DUF885 domain-containing protein [Pirellulaceae bacterium]|jgi:uncharacterized protein (DUF885 family)|nr:DUF885 domain-containing protein [Pirellulaceae bacterium]